MKELSIEEKAKAYDNVREKIAIRFGSNVAKEIFSEYEENEDERIRKDMIAYFKHDGTYYRPDSMVAKMWIAWLEKQGEWKPYGQREECLDCQVNYAGECKGSCAMKRGEQTPAWSEEDYNELETIACHLDNIGNLAMAESLLNIMNKYKSCRPQSTWKPSDEQMTALRRMKAAIAGEGEIYKPLNSLYEDLKKLKG